jgi:hypothetical protein
MATRPAAPLPPPAGPSAAPLAPAVRALPWVGSAFALSGDLPAFMVASYRRHGPAFRLKMLGREFTVLAGRDANLFMTHAGAALPRGHYPDPARFEPDRFLPPRSEHRVQGVYAPYGLGAHTCLGAGLAELQMVLTTATVLHHVRLRMHPPGYRLRSVMSPSLMPSRDFQMVVTERRAHH